MFTTTKLKNGLTIIQAPIAGARSLTVLAMLSVGSRYEGVRDAGSAHFLEHMLFKGTKRRPQPLDISRVLDVVGAEFNAFTSKEYTGYYVKVDHAFAERAIDLLADMVFHSLLEKKEFERERGVIIEEIRMYEDTPTRHVFDLVEESMYPGHKLGRNIAGSEESITAMRLADLRAFWRKYYQPNNVIMVVAGATDGVAEMITRHAGAERGRGASTSSFDCIPDRFRRTPRVVTKDTDQAHVALDFPALAYGAAGESATNILRTVLGGSMSSRLFVEIREKRGLAYTVSADVDRYRDTGNFQIYSGLDRARLPESLKIIAQEIRKIRANGVTEEELAEAKSHLRGKLTLQLEDSTELAVWYARGFLFYPDPWTPEQYIQRIEGVTVPMVSAMAKKILQPRVMGAACIGPYTEADFNQMLKKAFS